MTTVLRCVIYHFEVQYKGVIESEPVNTGVEELVVKSEIKMKGNFLSQQFTTLFPAASTHGDRACREAMRHIYEFIEETHVRLREPRIGVYATTIELIKREKFSMLKALYKRFNIPCGVDEFIMTSLKNLRRKEHHLTAHVRSFVREPLVRGQQNLESFYKTVTDNVPQNTKASNDYINPTNRDTVLRSLIKYLESDVQIDKMRNCLECPEWNIDQKQNCLEQILPEHRKHFEKVASTLVAMNCPENKFYNIFTRARLELRMAASVASYEALLKLIVVNKAIKARKRNIVEQ